jgi:DNA replication factor GINS
MNLDELQSVQGKERKNSSLQHLRDSFYEDVGEYVGELKNRRDMAAERSDDPFASPEVKRLTDEIETATDVVEKVYERRMGKLVKQASLAAAGMDAETEGMTKQEKQLFADLVDTIEANKSDVLDILAGEKAEATAGAPQDPEAAAAADAVAPEPGDAASVSAADMMGESGVEGDAAPDTEASAADASAGSPSDGDDHTPVDPAPAPDADRRPSEGDGDAENDADSLPADDGQPRPDGSGTATVGGDSTDGPESATADDADDGAGALAGLQERVFVRITDDVGEILGVDQREYDLQAEDVVALPEQNAAPLVERDAAERLD